MNRSLTVAAQKRVPTRERSVLSRDRKGADPEQANMKRLSHYDADGSARMVDVSAKAPTKREARAHAFVRIRPAVLRKLPQNPKGNPLEIARFAGIAAAKKTSELIPMCHPLMLTHADVEARIESRGVRITATASTTGQTGVEMEALTAAAVAALTVYDMTKALDKSIEIQEVYLLQKTGGKSGTYDRSRRTDHK
jgi:cyclic pyranopterin phosphate synthase